MDVCSICCEKYVLHSVATLTCGHEFCKDCITRWFKEDISCPECLHWDYAKLVKRLGGYHLFMKAKRPTLTVQGQEAMSLIAQMWNKTPPHAQKLWNDKACQDEADSAPPPAKSQKADADASPSPPSPATPKWSQAEVDAMTVPKLKAALTELGCETSGLKAVLKARLVEKLEL